MRDGLHAFRHRCARLTDLMQARTGYKNGTRKKGAFDCSHVDGDGERERLQSCDNRVPVFFFSHFTSSEKTGKDYIAYWLNAPERSLVYIRQFG